MICKATVDDIPVIRGIAERTWPVSYREMISPEQIRYMLDWMYSPDQLRREMEDGITFLRLDHQKQVIGFAAFDTEFLHKLYVLPEKQGHGHGAQLLKEVKSRIVGDTLRLRVNRNNARAISVYKKSGFSIESEICSDIGGGFVMDDYEMVAHLK